MPRDGDGVFTLQHDLVADKEAIPPILPSAERFQEILDDIAAQINDLEPASDITAQLAGKANAADVDASFEAVNAEIATKADAYDTTSLAELTQDQTDWGNDLFEVWDLSSGARKKWKASNLGITISAGNAVFYGTNTAALGINGVGYAGIGIAGFGGTTFVAAPNGTDARFAVSDTSAQLHYDNIALGKMKSSTVTISNGSPATITWTSHGLTAGTELAFSTTGSLPTGLTAGTRYYVIAAGLATNSFRVSATFGGSAVNTSSAGSGTHTAKAIAQMPGITFKVPDFNASNGGSDHPLMNLGVTEGASQYANTFVFEGGNAGGSSEAGIGWMVMTKDTSGVSIPRLHITGKDDNISIAVGVFGASSEVQGAFLQLHTSNAATSSHIHFTTATTGSNGTDGASVGLWTADELRIWHYESQPIIFGVANAEVARLTATGLGVGVTAAERLHAKSSGTGGTVTLRLDYANTSSGETHTSKFINQDTGAGTIRALFQAAGPLNAGVADQGVYGVFNESGTLRMFEVDSLAANSAARFRIYDRSNVATINLHGGGSSTFAGGALLNLHATAGIGYGTGAGGTVTQATSKSTGVTLDKACGTITMNNAALAAATSVSFTLTCAAIAATDLVVVNIKSGATANSYQATVSAVAAGSCSIHLRNISAGSLSEAVVLSYAVIKAVAA